MTAVWATEAVRRNSHFLSILHSHLAPSGVTVVDGDYAFGAYRTMRPPLASARDSFSATFTIGIPG